MPRLSTYASAATLDGDEKIIVVDDPSGTPINKNTTPAALTNYTNLNPPGVNAQTGTSYPLVAADQGKIVTLNNASPITLTVPNTLPVGFWCLIAQIGAGQVAVAGSSVTVHNASSHTHLSGQYAMARIVKYVSGHAILEGQTAA